MRQKISFENREPKQRRASSNWLRKSKAHCNPNDSHLPRHSIQKLFGCEMFSFISCEVSAHIGTTWPAFSRPRDAKIIMMCFVALAPNANISLNLNEIRSKINNINFESLIDSSPQKNRKKRTGKRAGTHRVANAALKSLYIWKRHRCELFDFEFGNMSTTHFKPKLIYFPFADSIN